MIKYQKTGGFAGQEDMLVIHSDGTLEFHSSISGKLVHDIKSTLKPDTVKKLVSLFEQEDFLSFENNYMAELPVFDRIVYTVTFSHKGRTQTVTTETEGHPPRGLVLIQTELEGIIAKLTGNQ